MFENKKVLIVDDEEHARLYLANIVRKLHSELTVFLAATPAESLFILEKEAIDLVLLDVELPGMTGLEMLRQLRGSQPALPVIFVSGYKRAEFVQQALRLEAVDYIDKPVDPEELATALFKALHPKEIVHAEKNEISRFCLFTTSGEMFVEAGNIVYFKANKRYSWVYMVDGTSKIVRDNLEGLAKKLPSPLFLRVSRQFIVNINAIRFISKANKTITLQANPPIVLPKIFPVVMKQLIERFTLKSF